MFKRFDPTPTDAQIHAWVDGRMPPEQRLRFEQELKKSEALWAQAQAWKQQRQQLAALHQDVLDEPHPTYLEQWARKTDEHAQTQSQWWKLGGVAASLVLSMGIGWSIGHHSEPRPMAQFAKQATLAHAVFQPEQRHPVEVGADQEQHLVQWLSNRLGQQLVVANLAPTGFELMGGRLLPGDSGPRAQLMYQNMGGDRITIYVGVLHTQQHLSSGMQYFSNGPVPAMYWVSNGKAFAVSGQLPQADLHQLAQHAYTQMINMQPI
jgi:anti-sigma factor RsiW